MKSEELRIGNYVTTIDRSGDVHLQNGITEMVGAIKFTYIYLLDYKKPIYGQSYRIENLSNITPIPLTEEWLLKFGFEIDDEKGRWAIMSNPCWILHRLDNNEWGVKFWQGHNIKYVHQLQNLYFALTNEELKITE